MAPIRWLMILSAILALGVPAAANKPRDKELSFIYLHDTDSTTMSGSLTDLERVRKSLKQRGERLLWFRTAAGKEFVIRDVATLGQFEAIWKPANALAAQQGVIGTKQGLIGTRQGAIGAQQGAIGAKQGALASKQAALDLRADAARTAGERDAIAKQRRAIDSEMRDLEKRMRVLEKKMAELEPPMRELEQQMDAVGKQHETAAKQAHANTEALLARAITTGTARPF